MKRRKPKKVSMIVVVEATDMPGTFSLIRSDNPDGSGGRIWCGPAGWLPQSAYAWKMRFVYMSQEEAEADSDRLAKPPLVETPGWKQN
jgi:hypothetical protein